MAYIEKEKAQMFLRTDCLKRFPASFANGLLVAAEQLNKIPTADVAEVKHGEWEVCSDEYEISDNEFVCSACKESFFVSNEMTDEQFFEMMKYCPNCGAKMDGKKEGA